MKDKFFIQPLSILKAKPLKKHGLKAWQAEALENVKNARFSIVEAPCGSGKSILQIADGVVDHTRRSIVLIPQRHISDSFKDKNLNIYGNHYEWILQNNFAVGDSLYPEQAKIDLFMDALSGKYPAEEGVAYGIVATHQLFALLWKRLAETMPPKQILELFQNVCLRVDEAHHVGYNRDEIGLQNNIKTSTILGDAINFLLDHKNEHNSRIMFTTATYSRTDGGKIVDDEHNKLFYRHTYTFAEHWADNLKSIKSINLSYPKYDENPIEEVLESIRQQKKHQHLVILPPMNTKWRNNPNQVPYLVTELRKIFPNEHEVIDLINEKTVGRKQLAISSDNIKNKKHDPLKVVVTCRMFDEATDWVKCDRIHNTDGERSPNLGIQRVGRGTREHKDKESLSVYFYNKNKVCTVESYKEHVAAMCVNMIIADQLQPLRLPSLPKMGKCVPKEGSEKTKTITLSEIFGSRQSEACNALFYLTSLKEDNYDNIKAYMEQIVIQFAPEFKDREVALQVIGNTFLKIHDTSWEQVLDIKKIAEKIQHLLAQNESTFSIGVKTLEEIKAIEDICKYNKIVMGNRWLKFHAESMKYQSFNEIPVEEWELKRWLQQESVRYFDEEIACSEERQLLDSIAELLKDCRSSLDNFRQEAESRRNKIKDNLLQQAAITLEQDEKIFQAREENFLLEERLEPLLAFIRKDAPIISGTKYKVDGKTFHFQKSEDEITLNYKNKSLVVRRTAQKEKMLLDEAMRTNQLDRPSHKTKIKKINLYKNAYVPINELDTEYLQQFIESASEESNFLVR